MPNAATTMEKKIESLLTGDAKKNAFDFVGFVKANKIPSKRYVISVVGDGGDFPHIRPWVLFFNACDFDAEKYADEHLKAFAWAHAHVCDHFITDGKRCGCGRQPGSRKTIFGKDFENICHCPLQFINPDAETVENIEKLLLLF